MRWAVALTALFFAPQLALAAPAASAAAPNVIQQGGVPSPKGDGKVMYPMRRTPQKDRGDAAIRAQAFAFGSQSLDAALLVYLEPGAYTAVVSGPTNASAAAGSGIALVEIYESNP